MSGECEQCSEHCLDCRCSKCNTKSKLMEINEKSLVKLLSTVIIDFKLWQHRIGLTDESTSLRDVSKYCESWIQENLSDSHPDPIRSYDVKLRITSKTKGLPVNYEEEI